jgi:hypothetical protein
VVAAALLATDGPTGSGTESGLDGLHAAMGAGRLDSYRASVVAHELEAAPAQVRHTVVTLLEAHFALEDAAHLRRRCRRALARISPDLLRQRALRARAACGLRRWVEEPGVDRWEGTFPSEDAARAWAAIDALARQYITDGACTGIEAARGRALTDLVAGHATIETRLTLTVPAAVLDESAATGRTGTAAGGADLVEVTGPAGNQPVLVSRAWVTATAQATPVQVAPCHPVTGALLDTDTAGTYRPSTRLARLVRARDRRCRFPGCTVAAVFCDLDHVRPWPAGPTTATNLICLCRRHHRVKQRPGWQATLTPDGTITWADPTGRTRTTHPADALTSTVLPGAATPPTSPTSPTSPSRARTLVPDGPHTALEFTLEHHGTTPPGQPRALTTTWRDHHTRRHRTDLAPTTATITLAPHGHWPHQRSRPHHRDGGSDPPPF